MKLYTLFFFLVICIQLSEGAQFSWIKKDTAAKAVSLIKKHEIIRQICASCEDTVWENERVFNVKSKKVKGEPWWNVSINNLERDLAYLYVPDKGVWTNLALLLQLKPAKVPHHLPEKTKKELARQKSDSLKKAGIHYNLKPELTVGKEKYVPITYWAGGIRSRGKNTVYLHGSKVRSLDRKKNKVRTIHPHKKGIYRFAPGRNGAEILFGYEYTDKILHHFVESGKSVWLPPVDGIKLLKDLHYDEKNHRAVIYVTEKKNFQYHGFKIILQDLNPPHAVEEISFPKCRVLFTHKEEVIYATLNEEPGHPRNGEWYHKIEHYNLGTRKTRNIYSYKYHKPVKSGYAVARNGKIDTKGLYKNQVAREGPAFNIFKSIYSRTGNTEGFYVHDKRTGDQLIFVYNRITGKVSVDTLPYEAVFLEGSMSYKEDYLTALFEYDGSLWHLYFNLEKQSHTYQDISELSYKTFKKDISYKDIHKTGTLSNNKTMWIHWGDYLFLMGDGGYHVTDIKGFIPDKGKEKVSWAGATYYFGDPDEFYFGIEKGKGRYYLKVEQKFFKIP